MGFKLTLFQLTGMQRYFLELSFKGTNFHGWQIQPNAISIQSTLNKALSTILQEEIKTVGVGRTDTGVHAKYFVAHFDSGNVGLTTNKNIFLKKINSILPVDISILDFYSVTPGAHARFSALKRTYEYTILKYKNPFIYEFGWFTQINLDINKMNRAVEFLYQVNDFTSFSKLHTNVKNNICHIYQAYWNDMPDKYVFKIIADRFLRNMVRAIVGTLIDVGRGKLSVQDFKIIIDKRERSSAGASVPACGLALTYIEYPDNIKNNIN